MHPYITDSDERRDVALVLAAIAIGLSLGLSYVFRVNHVQVPGWIDVTSVAAYYGGLTTLFDKLCWRWPILHRLGIVKVPTLCGDWKGYILSSHDDFASPHEVRLHIEQSWTRMRILLEGEFSHSHSFLGAILTDAQDGITLDYEYQNDPAPGAREAMQIHYGTARLRVVSPAVMEGHYYTGRGRSNFGRIHLSRT